MSLTRCIQLKDTVPNMNLFASMVQLNTTWGNTATPHVIVSIYSILENFQIQMSSRGANSFPEAQTRSQNLLSETFYLVSALDCPRDLY